MASKNKERDDEWVDAPPATPNDAGDEWSDAPPDAEWVDAPPAAEEDDPFKGTGKYKMDPTSKPLMGLDPAPVVEGALEVAAPIIEPFAKGLDRVDNVTAAPVRAGIEAKRKGGSFVDGARDQLNAGIGHIDEQGNWVSSKLPTTPSTEQWAKEIGGGPMIQSATSVLLGGVTDPLQLIPGLAATKGVAAADRGAQALLGAGTMAAGKAENAAGNIIFRTGRALTQRNIDVDDALRAASRLKSYELMAPGLFIDDANRAVGELRQQFGAQKELTIPGSHEAARAVLEDLQEVMPRIGSDAAMGEAQKTIDYITARMFEPVQVALSEAEVGDAYLQAKNHLNAIANDVRQIPKGDPARAEAEAMFHQAMDQVDEIAGGYQAHISGNPQFFRTEMRPKDLTLQELDDIVRERLDQKLYTDQGNERARTSKILQPAIKQVRRSMNNLFQTIPEGQLFQAAKSRDEALLIADKRRGKLFEGLSQLGAPAAGAGAAGIASMMGLDPVVAGMVGFLSTQALRPRAYMQAMGLAKLPGDAVRALDAAYRSGSMAAVRDTLSEVAKRHPQAAERFTRAVVLASGKEDSEQFLGNLDEKDLMRATSDDPKDMMSEMGRVQNDRKMSSIEKAKALNGIARNGFVFLPDAPTSAPPPAPLPPAPQTTRSPAELKALLQSTLGR